MATKKKNDDTKKAVDAPDGSTVTASRETLDGTPGRLLDLLKAIGTRPPIRGILEGVGYTPAEHLRGWNLLHACTGFYIGSPVIEVDRKVVAATSTLDKSDERTDTLIDASLKHRAPNVRAFLVEGIKTGTGAESVLYFATLVPRLQAVHAGTAEGLTAAEQSKASDVLEERGLGVERCAELAALVKEAQGVNSAPAPAPLDRTELDAALRAARAFYEEWSEIARVEIKRRDYLILLGLATRRSRTTEDEEGVPAEPVPATPPRAAPSSPALPPLPTPATTTEPTTRA